MAIKIYSGYDEFKYEEPEICDYIEEFDNYQEEKEEEKEELYEDLFFKDRNENNFNDFSTFYLLSDSEDGENAEDIAGYLGKFKRIDIKESHKILFCIV